MWERAQLFSKISLVPLLFPSAAACGLRPFRARPISSPPSATLDSAAASYSVALRRRDHTLASASMNQAIAPQSVFDELDLGSARGGKAGINRVGLDVQVVRALGEADLPAILEPPPVAQPGQALQSIRHSHHRLAQLIAEGKPMAEVALVTGYSASRLSVLQGDPAFEELVTYYAEMRKTIFVDAQERLKALGLDATEKLHEQLHDPTQTWTRRELMDVIKMGLPAETGSGQKLAVASPNTQPGGGFTLNVKFVGAGEAQVSASPSSTIDGDYQEIK